MTIEELRSIWGELEKACEAQRNGEPIPDSDIDIIFIKEQNA